MLNYKNMFTTVLIICLMLSLCVFNITAYAAASVISVGNVSGSAGNIVEVPINITGSPGVSCFGITVNYDYSRLTPVGSAIDGSESIIKGIWSKDLIYNANYGAGKVFVTGSSITNATGNGIFLKIKFKIKSDALGSAAISLTVNELMSANGTNIAPIEHTTNSGAVTISSETILEVGNISASAGSIVEVPINIIGNPGIVCFGITIHYDDAGLLPVGHVLTGDESVVKGIWNNDIIYNAGYGVGKVFVAGASATNINGNGTLFKVKFQLKSAATGSAGVSLTINELMKVEGTVLNPIIAETKAGIINIIDGSPEFTISNLFITNHYGNEIIKLPSSGAINVTAIITKNKDSAHRPVVVIGLYDMNHRLKELKCRQIQMGDGQTLPLSTSLPLDDVSSGDYAKIILWDDLSSMKPIHDLKELH